MARLARVVAVGVPHHITQRGNARRFILQDEVDRKIYLDLLLQSLDLHGVALIGYCLMSNHVHLIAIPRKADVLARALKEAHGRFASYWNALHHSTGHVWQGRYYSCPLDEPHLWESLSLHGAQSGARLAGDRRTGTRGRVPEFHACEVIQ